MKRNNAGHNRSTNAGHRGMTMLEILLALGVLAVSLVSIASISRMSTMSAMAARETTQAQLLAESVMAQLLCGMIEFESVYDEPVLDFVDTDATNPNDNSDYKWVYAVEINSIDDFGLCEVIVTVTKYNPNATREPASCQLVRWMLDKATALEMLESQESSTDSTTDASSNSSTGSSQGGNTGGGNTGGGNTGGGNTGGGNTGGGNTGGGNTGGGNTGGGGRP